MTRTACFEKVERKSGKSENYLPDYDVVLQAAQAGDRKRVDQRAKAVLAGQNPLREFWSTRPDRDVRRIEPFFSVKPEAWEGGRRSASLRCKTSAGSFASGAGDGAILRCTWPVTTRAASAGVQ